MSIFGFVKEWGAGAARINNSDKMITSLVGANPKSYHPDIYKGILQEVINFENSEIRGEKLNVTEFTAIRMCFFSLIAENAEDYGVVQTYVDAIGRLSRACKSEIRPIINNQIIDLTSNLSCRDSFVNQNT